jgi:hypothetical protein
MRYENVVGRYFFDVDRFRERVLGDKWIKQQVFPLISASKQEWP